MAEQSRERAVRIVVALALGVVSLAAPARTNAQSDTVSAVVNICDRTEKVRTAILAAREVTASDCTLVSASELAEITALSLVGKSIKSLQAGDFDGLTGLEKLEMDDNLLAGIPEGVFDQLTNLKKLDLCGNSLRGLPLGVFDKLTRLETLNLYDNLLLSLPLGVFDQLTRLETLNLYHNRGFLTTLRPGVFDQLTRLKVLSLRGNGMPSLRPGVFDQLTRLEVLILRANGLRSLPPGVFDRLTSLTTLDLSNNRDLSYSPYLLSPLTSLTNLNDSPYTRPLAPGAPTNLTATFADGTIELRWTTPTTGSSPTSYRILRAKDGAAQEAYVDDTYDRDSVAVTYTDTGVTGGETYWYHVKALNAGGASPESNAAEVTAVAPGTVTGVAVTVGVEQLMVSWNAVSGADGYQVQWKFGSQQFDATRQYTVAGGSTVTYTISDLIAGTEYAVRVIATKADTENCPPSASVAGTPKAPAPGQVTGVRVIPRVEQLRVSWNAVSAASGYQVQWKSGSQQFDATRRQVITDGVTIAYTIPSLTPGIPYSVRVTASRENADDGAPSATVHGTPKAPAPGQVTGVRVIPRVEQLRVSWNAVSAASGYQVQWKSGSQQFDATRRQVITDGVTIAYTIPSLTPGIPYSVRVTASRENADDGAPSATVHGTPKAPAAGQVTGVRVTPRVEQLRVSWNAVTGADGYRVQWKSGAQRFGATRQRVITDGVTTAYTIRSLTPGIRYSVRVIASRENADDGPPSATVHGTPKAQVSVAPKDGTTSVSEGTAVEFTLTRTGSAAAVLAVTVRVTQTGDVIKTPAAYQTPTIVDFAVHEATATLTVETTDDAVEEVTGFVTALVMAGEADSYAPGNPASAMVMVTDNDTGRPTVTIASVASFPANAMFTVTITFSERVSSLALEAIQVTNGTVANLTGSATTYYAEITPNDDFVGNVTVTIAAAAAIDADGRGNLETSADFAVDTKAPERMTLMLDRPIEEWTAPTDTGAPTTVDGVEYPGSSSGRLAVASDDDTAVAPGAQRGSLVVLAYDEALDENSTPPVSAFTVRVGESPRAVSAVAVRGSMVRLTPLSPVPHGETVTVSYTVPAGATANPIRDVARNAASGFTDESVTNGPGVASAARERYAQVNRAVLPYAVAATGARTLAAIGNRIDSAGSGAATESRLSLAGVSMPGPVAAAARESSARLVETVPWEINDNPRTTSLEELLGGASFVVPLAAAAGEAERAGNAGTVAVWGSGDYGHLAGGVESAVDWSGDLLSIHVGVDVPVLAGLLAGVAAAWSSGGFEYEDRTDPGVMSGEYEIDLISVHPYVSWSAPGVGLRLWATGSYGWGGVAIDNELYGKRTSATRVLTGAVGGSGRLLAADGLIAGGTTVVRLKGEGFLARVEVEGNGPIEPLKLDTARLRGAVEGSHEQRFRWGRLTPTLEVGVRYDHGDGAEGAGLELGGELRYAYPEFGLTVAGHGRLLATHRDAYEEWGVGGLIRIDPGADRRGLSLSVAPSWGASASRSQALWEHGAAEEAPEVRAAGSPPPAGRLDVEIGYGLPALHGQAVLTPYGGLSLAGEAVRGYRAGARLELAEFNLSLEGTRRAGAGAADHGVTLSGGLRY